MSAPELNRPVDDFEAPATGDQTIRLSDLKWRGVKVPGHVDEVLEAVRSL
ncbi:hypothetical protein NLU14_17940 [Marinobacter sp. 71-i]|uniref:Uncharacterized protein n=1 Tax=Marinobacter iranensis TaxID=2962607 RepID=A0ABT5YEM5_9GAMM|nr:hypothetical protein [Marinobacter iranensis]MDF0752115.1 hypothetical protein [Marinobacter iranensis]